MVGPQCRRFRSYQNMEINCYKNAVRESRTSGMARVGAVRASDSANNSALASQWQFIKACILVRCFNIRTNQESDNK
jgi:hypothetical protein